jgi:hypothetical protein
MAETVELDLHWHQETDKAIMVSENGVDDETLWLPKSQIEYERTRTGVRATVPVWLAEKEGLV